MYLCSEDHGEVCYEKPPCPTCEAREGLLADLAAVTESLGMAETEGAAKHQTIVRLNAQLDETAVQLATASVTILGLVRARDLIVQQLDEARRLG